MLFVKSNAWEILGALQFNVHIPSEAHGDESPTRLLKKSTEEKSKCPVSLSTVSNYLSFLTKLYTGQN